MNRKYAGRLVASGPPCDDGRGLESDTDKKEGGKRRVRLLRSRLSSME